MKLKAKPASAASHRLPRGTSSTRSRATRVRNKVLLCAVALLVTIGTAAAPMPIAESSIMWEEVDQFEGQDTFQEFGRQVAMSDDTSRLAIGMDESTWAYDRLVAGNWQGHTSIGNPDPSFGSAIALSGDGTTLVVGAPDYAGDAGYIIVFRRDVDRWIHEYMVTGTAGDKLGTAVDVSDDGMRVAIGVPGNDNVGLDAGAVLLVERLGPHNWNQLGATIEGSATGDEFGSAVALSGDGTTVVGSSHLHGGLFEGQVRVHRFGGSTWDPVGAAIIGSGWEQFGWAVDISDDGSIVVGTSREAYSENGVARIFAESSGAWTPVTGLLGINGTDNDFGTSVALTDDGTGLVVGAPSWQEGAGIVHVYTNQTGTWLPDGDWIYAQPDDWGFGTSVAVDAAAGHVVVGAPFSDVNIIKEGRVRIFAKVPGLVSEDPPEGPTCVSPTLLVASKSATCASLSTATLQQSIKGSRN